MQLGDLLTELRENILRDVSDRISGTPDWLWSDAQLIRYIDLAHKRFAKRSLIIRDATTPEVVEICLQTGVQLYELHPSVIAVISAKFNGEMDLHRAGHTAFDAYRAPDPLWFDVNSQFSSTPGKPVAFSTDEEVRDDGDGRLRLVTLKTYPVPSSTYDNVKLYLRVCRGPLDDLRSDNLLAEPEIPEDYQIEMLDFAAARALMTVDRDAGDAARADRFMASFNAAVEQAKTEVMRKLFSRQEWGFGRNGWNWDR